MCITRLPTSPGDLASSPVTASLLGQQQQQQPLQAGGLPQLLLPSSLCQQPPPQQQQQQQQAMPVSAGMPMYGQPMSYFVPQAQEPQQMQQMQQYQLQQQQQQQQEQQQLRQEEQTKFMEHQLAEFRARQLELKHKQQLLMLEEQHREQKRLLELQIALQLSKGAALPSLSATSPPTTSERPLTALPEGAGSSSMNNTINNNSNNNTSNKFMELLSRLSGTKPTVQAKDSNLSKLLAQCSALAKPVTSSFPQDAARSSSNKNCKRERTEPNHAAGGSGKCDRADRSPKRVKSEPAAPTSVDGVMCRKAVGQGRKRHVAPITSDFRGVSWHRRDKVWLARAWLDGKIRHLGCFKLEELAALAVDLRHIAQFGETGRALNFPNRAQREELIRELSKRPDFKLGDIAAQAQDRIDSDDAARANKKNANSTVKAGEQERKPASPEVDVGDESGTDSESRPAARELGPKLRWFPQSAGSDSDAKSASSEDRPAEGQVSPM